jgi:hypothetical protein
MTERIVNLDDVPVFKIIDGHKYKYYTWTFSRKYAEDSVSRFKMHNPEKNYSFRIIPHGKGGNKEYRIYFRSVK